MHKNMYLYKILHSLIRRSKKEMTQDNSAPLLNCDYPQELSTDGNFVSK